VLQAELDALLSRRLSVPVALDSGSPPNVRKAAYRELPLPTFAFAVRSLLHAVGKKTVPVSIGRDEALRAAHRYVHILDLQSRELRFRPSPDSDNRTNESREIGLGVACLLASRVWKIPWDQLETIRGPGKRFDLRGERPNLTAIIEAKGSTSRARQRERVADGLAKKAAHHKRGEHHDVELVAATRIGTHALPPQIVLADPPFDTPEDTFGPRGQKVYRLRHGARLMRYAGAPDLAYELYLHSISMARDGTYRRPRYRRRRYPRRVDRPSESIRVGDFPFVGQWYASGAPDSPRYHRQLEVERAERKRWPSLGRVAVFQGVREDVFGLVEGERPAEVEVLITEEEAPARPSAFDAAELSDDQEEHDGGAEETLGDRRYGVFRPDQRARVDEGRAGDERHANDELLLKPAVWARQLLHRAQEASRDEDERQQREKREH
jgi:hypothetical protein